MTLSTAQTSHGARRRPRRIAADEAHAWARNLRLGNPYAKLVLSMLTLYVDGAGSCFVGIEALAEDAELSTDTVRKRLAWLENVGAIVRLPQWIDGNGRRNSDERGKRTSDEIRLLVNADPDAIEARALGDVGTETNAEQVPVSPSPQRGLNPDAGEGGPRSALGQPSDSSEGLISEPEPEKKDNPPTPLRGEDSGSTDQEGEAEWVHAESWSRFEAAWREPIVHQEICRQIWAAFTDVEREAAIKAAKGYVAWRLGQKRPPNICNAQKILREHQSWPRFAALAPEEKPPPAPKTKINIDVHSAEFAAIALCRAIARLTPIPPNAAAITFTGEPPAGAAGMAQFVCFKEKTNEVVQDGWTIAPKGSPRFAAWCERVKEWIGIWPQDHRYWLDEHGNIVPSAVQAYREPGRLPKSQDGLLMPPGDWPPPKGTKIERQDSTE